MGDSQLYCEISTEEYPDDFSFFSLLCSATSEVRNSQKFWQPHVADLCYYLIVLQPCEGQRVQPALVDLLGKMAQTQALLAQSSLFYLTPEALSRLVSYTGGIRREEYLYRHLLHRETDNLPVATTPPPTANPPGRRRGAPLKPTEPEGRSRHRGRVEVRCVTSQMASRVREGDGPRGLPRRLLPPPVPTGPARTLPATRPRRTIPSLKSVMALACQGKRGGKKRRGGGRGREEGSRRRRRRCPCHAPPPRARPRREGGGAAHTTAAANP